MKHWVIDTNVVVSGLLVPQGQPGRILDAVTDGNITMVYDQRILNEYREVLNRPQLKLAPAKIAEFLSGLRHQELVATTQRLPAGPDPDDLMFIEVALATRQKTIVTGNAKDFPRAIRHGVRILSPAQAMEQLSN
jgi:putative PIN family toxin of toxin-antitoxin system